MLEEVHAQHALNAYRRPPGAGLRVDRLDPFTPNSPRHHPVHLGPETGRAAWSSRTSQIPRWPAWSARASSAPPVASRPPHLGTACTTTEDFFRDSLAVVLKRP